MEAIQNQMAEKLLTAELMTMANEGNLHPGFSSLYGRLGGIWKNEEALKKILGDVPDLAPDIED